MLPHRNLHATNTHPRVRVRTPKAWLARRCDFEFGSTVFNFREYLRARTRCRDETRFLGRRDDSRASQLGDHVDVETASPGSDFEPVQWTASGLGHSAKPCSMNGIMHEYRNGNSVTEFCNDRMTCRKRAFGVLDPV